MSVRARMKVQSITAQPTYVSVTLAAIYSSDPQDPNYSYSQATPSGSLNLTITNPAVFDAFSEGDVFDIDITPYVPEPVAETKTAEDTAAAQEPAHSAETGTTSS